MPAQLYSADVSREGRWWMIRVPDLDAVTQARTPDEVELMARELIACTLDVDLESVAVDLHRQDSGAVS